LTTLLAEIKSIL